MAVVLFAWELGGGMGHVDRMLKLARPLAALGHHPVFAVRDVIEPAPLLAESGFPVLQAPYYHPRPNRGNSPFLASSFADILGVVGFDDPSHLRAMVEPWEKLLDLVQPRLIIADHAPTLCLTAYQRSPVVMVGNGFTVPPTGGSEFPPLPTSVEAQSSQEKLLENIQAVQRQRKRPEPARVTDFMRTNERFILTWPELDPYRLVRGEETLLGPLAKPPTSPVPAFPKNPRFFAYVSADFPGIEKILAALVRGGLAGEAYVRGLSAAGQARLQRPELVVHARPVPIEDALARSSVLLHHAGLGTAEAALAAGRPQVGLPRHCEQQLTSNALERLGVARSLSGTIRISEIVQAVSNTDTSSNRKRAIELAHELRGRHSRDVVAQVLDRCQRFLG